MDSDLHALAYFSHSTIPYAGGGLANEIARILTSARRKNLRHGLTGALLVSGDCFAQVLEGPLFEVSCLFDVIQADTRHRSVTILHFQAIKHRFFANFSMAYAGQLDPAAIGLDIDGLLKSPDRIGTTPAGRHLVSLLRDLIARQSTVVA